MPHIRVCRSPVSRFITCGGRYYFNHPHHRGQAMASAKSIWCIGEDEECHLFCQAENTQVSRVRKAQEIWVCSGDVRTPFGSRGEIVARFFPPQVGSTDWHGHPVGKGSPSKTKSAPPDVISGWRADGTISRALAKKLRKQVI